MDSNATGIRLCKPDRNLNETHDSDLWLDCIGSSVERLSYPTWNDPWLIEAHLNSDLGVKSTEEWDDPSFHNLTFWSGRILLFITSKRTSEWFSRLDYRKTTRIRYLGRCIYIIMVYIKEEKRMGNKCNIAVTYASISLRFGLRLERLFRPYQILQLESYV